MARKTYICGNCGARFTVEGTPRGCPVCWSENTAIISSRPTPQEALKHNLKIVEEASEQIAVLHQQIVKIRRDSLSARQYINKAKANGRIDHVPTYKDYL